MKERHSLVTGLFGSPLIVMDMTHFKAKSVTILLSHTGIDGGAGKTGKRTGFPAGEKRVRYTRRINNG
ncbi:MAG: hypothetical protein COT17_00095 [Elusimicrobia bacterium CG08_land_8_20_14_0_20_51_18]|nr:MAG: hypothetical protein COT17_00095 [Elusimicrobia bacterium CG08_land_8_20_14_0_20_51_18]